MLLTHLIFKVESCCEFFPAPDPNFEKAMESEHCSKTGNDFKFVTSNYGIETCPSREYKIVTCDAKERPSLTASEGAHGRKIPCLQELEKLPASKEAKLRLIEVVMLVLYTGPMVSSHYLSPSKILLSSPLIRTSS